MKQRGAFSLVELLVVIGVLSVLAALLLPAMEKALETSRQSVCMNNLRQIHLSAGLYSEDFNDWIVPQYGWPNIPTGGTPARTPASMYYFRWNRMLGKLGYAPLVDEPPSPLCPSDLRQVIASGFHVCPSWGALKPPPYSNLETDGWTALNPFQWNGTQYGLNSHISVSGSGSKWRRRSEIPSPHRIWYFADRSVGDSVFIYKRFDVGTDRHLPHYRHDLGTTVAFVDGGVKREVYRNETGGGYPWSNAAEKAPWALYP